MFFGSIPNFATAAVLVDIAAKCFAIAASSLAVSRNHARAVWALVIVSWVVKVLDATRKSTVSGFTSFKVSTRSVLSTLETKWTRKPGFPYGLRASQTIFGPR